jgi:Uma2 family endonuclease
MKQPRTGSVTRSSFYERRSFPEGKEDLVRGFVVRKPAPAGRHGVIVTELVFLLRSHLRDAALGGTVLTGTGFIVAKSLDQVRVPDVAYVGPDRAGVLGPALVDGAADLAVEVLSPSNSPDEIAARIDDHLRRESRVRLTRCGESSLTTAWSSPRRAARRRAGTRPLVARPHSSQS